RRSDAIRAPPAAASRRAVAGKATDASAGSGAARGAHRGDACGPADAGDAQRGRLAGHAPAHRFDIEIEADLIEEVARVVGFEAIPESAARVPQGFRSLPEEHPPEAAVLGMLAARGYEEAITLAFVDPQLQERLFPGRVALALSNPIASDLSVMRVSLWPGLLRAALENQRRQADRTRLFEHGTRF